MKKIFALLLATLMLVTLISCSPKKVDGPGFADETGENGEGTGDGFVTPLWSLEYDKDIWTLYEEDASSEEEYCNATLQVLNPEDPEYYLINVDITAVIDEPYDFREDLVYYGFDQYEYVNDSYDLTEIGGVECLTHEEEGWSETTLRYFNRVEGAGANVEVVISAEDVTDSRISDLLAGLKFTLTDISNEDGPWEWEGEAFSADAASVGAGSFTIDTKWIPINEYISTFETFNHGVAAVGNTVYILTEGVLKQYTFDGSALNFEKDIDLEEDDYESIMKTTDGSLWLTGGMNDLIRIKDGGIAETYEDLDTVAVSPDGGWGVSYFVSNECKIVTLNGGTASATDVVFSEMDSVSYISVDNDTVYACGNAADESGHKVFIYNKEGVLQKTLCNAEGENLGSITYFAKTANGYIGFDGNMRTVVLWDNDGGFIAELEDSDLFGTSYPWFCGSDMMDDGSIITVMTEDRADRSAMELVAFVVKGF